MEEIIDAIPTAVFETMGTVAGLVACFFIAVQAIKELKTTTPSSLSHAYVIGWFVVFMFWTFYGIRFRTNAIIISNVIATFLQGVLLYAVLRKEKKAYKQK